MKPDVQIRFNGGSPVVTVEMHGYLQPREAIEHAYELIRAGVACMGARVDDSAAWVISEHREVIARLKPIIDVADDIRDGRMPPEALQRMLRLFAEDVIATDGG